MLERCADCRRICTCYLECTCSTLDETGTMRCHACTDAHDMADS